VAPIWWFDVEKQQKMSWGTELWVSTAPV